jgi:drug/metabolite transporter (DMT)-like permease
MSATRVTEEMTPKLQMGPVEWGLLAALSLIWGASFLFGRIAVQEIPPFSVAWIRVGLAAAILSSVVLATRSAIPRDLKGWAPYLLMGLLNNVLPFSLIFWGQKEIGAGLAAVLNATTPLFAGVIAHVFSADEKLGPAKIAGIVIGIAGVAVLVGPDAFGALGGHVMSELAVLAGAISYGFAGLWGRRFRATPPITSACCQLLCSTVILTPIVVLIDRPWLLPAPSPTVILALLGLAVLCTAIAYVIFFTIIKRAGSTNVMLVTLLIPPSAMLLGAIFLNERLAAPDLLGAAIIGLALLVIDGRLVRWFSAKP